MAKYSVHQQPVDTLLTWVKTEQIAIPELQRPFVWNSRKVRDLLDSLYNGYPVGYLITWQSIGARLRGGEVAQHQQILIDGQQRVTALRTAIAAETVIDKSYRSVRIVTAFNPVTETFETVTPVLKKNPEWIPDISEVFMKPNYQFVSDYLARNPGVEQDRVVANIQRLHDISHAQIGLISLADDLEVETVSEIFIRINSKGVPLGAADFAMSKIATYGDRGRQLRKLIDYFCHLAIAPHVDDDIAKGDPDFRDSRLMDKIKWLKDDTDDLYDPSYSDVIRVASLVGFGRGRIAALVSELSGRDPETKKVDESLIEPAYDRLDAALLRYVREYDFKQFLMVIKSAGFINPSMIVARNALNFAYALYLRLRDDASVTDAQRKTVVRRWFVMSLLTGRASGSFETAWEQDIRRIGAQGAAAYLKTLEEVDLSDAFWTVALPQNLDTSSARSPYFQAFLAAQVARGARGFLSRHIKVQSMLEQQGDIHHILPKDYLRKNGFNDRQDYNQVANFVLTETPVNIRIGNRMPADYMAEVDAQMASGVTTLGEISNDVDLASNFSENAVPADLRQIDASSYRKFLETRRRLMAAFVRIWYQTL